MRSQFERLADTMMAEKVRMTVGDKKVMMTQAKAFLHVLFKKARNGNMAALKLVLDRTWPAVALSNRHNVNVNPSDVLEVLARLKEQCQDNGTVSAMIEAEDV